MNKIIYVGGGKGGVGKSLLSFATLDFFIEKKEKPVLIETDTSNPDVYKAHNQENDIQCVSIDLDDSNGWIKLVDTCDEYKDRPIVINSAARNEKGVKQFSTTLKETLPELKREMYIFWAINRQKDSLTLLKTFRNFFDSPVFVWRNLYYGNEDKFELYQYSQLIKDVEATGLSLNFPELADRVADVLYSNRMSIRKAFEELSIGNRAELKRWKNLYLIEMEKIKWI